MDGWIGLEVDGWIGWEVDGWIGWEVDGCVGCKVSGLGGKAGGFSDRDEALGGNGGAGVDGKVWGWGKP